MGLGSRLYQVLRANVGHYVREASERLRGRTPGGPDSDAGFHAEAPGGRTAKPGPSTGDDVRARYAPDYALLEIPFGSGREAVRSAHRSLLRRFHPDRFARDPDGLADATRLSQEITAARDRILKALESGEIANPTR